MRGTWYLIFFSIVLFSVPAIVNGQETDTSLVVDDPRWQFEPSQRVIEGYSLFAYDGRYYIQVRAVAYCRTQVNDLRIFLPSDDDWSFGVEDKSPRTVYVIFNRRRSREGYGTVLSSKEMIVSFSRISWKMANNSIVRVELIDVLSGRRYFHVIFDLFGFDYEYRRCKDVVP